jgi:hypothetical protein
MIRVSRKSAVRLVSISAGAALLLYGNGVFAADHLDGPAASADPAADITDVFAWAQNGNSLNMIMNVFPAANADSRFSDAVQYVFHVRSQSGFGSVENESTLVCTFSAEQAVSCSLDGEELVADTDASATGGFVNAAGNFRIFTGLRKDPFFFALNNFNVVRRAVRDAVPSLVFDEAGCPTLDQPTKDVLVSSLVGSGGLPGADSPAVDFFGPLNVLSIVVQADKGLFGQGPVYAVSGTTHRRPS